MRITIWGLLICYLFPTLSSAEEVFPKACKPLAIQQESILLNSAKQRVIMLHNLSKHDVWIASHDLSGRIKPNHWSALALDTSAIELNCVESRPGHEQQVSCEHIIGVCEWATEVRPKDIKGIFWAGENMTLEILSAYLARRGFTLPEEKT